MAMASPLQQFVYGDGMNSISENGAEVTGKFINTPSCRVIQIQAIINRRNFEVRSPYQVAAAAAANDM
jgi:hypothetical protein